MGRKEGDGLKVGGSALFRSQAGMRLAQGLGCSPTLLTRDSVIERAR